MVFTFTASWVLWLRIILSRREFSVVKFFSKFTPSGAPGYLAPILSLIEIVSKAIRPLTLSLRLSINITTGHVFIRLMGISSSGFFLVVLLM